MSSPINTVAITLPRRSTWPLPALYSYSWTFGDGSTSTAQNPNHVYSSACTCTATLTVTDNSTPAKTATSAVTVTVSAVCNPLAANASATPTSGQTPLSVAFTGGTPPYSYSWTFGDGSTSAVQNSGHTYNAACTCTAILTVTDSSTLAKTATSSVTVTASPIAGTPPGAPTGLAATAGKAQASVNWTAPASNGVNVTSYKVYRGTSPGTETLLTSGGCGSLGVVLSCTDTGLANGQPYFYKVGAVNALGEGAQSNEASATPVSPACTPTQLFGNPGFETGTVVPWTASSGVVADNSSEPPRSGTWDAWLDGYGTTYTDTLTQTVTLSTGCSSDTLSFWSHIDTAETPTTTTYDTLTVQALNSTGTALGTLATYSNIDHNTDYTQRAFNLAGYAGQTITLKFTGAEDFTKQTSSVIDDTAITIS